MPLLTMEQAEDYLDQIEDALTAAGFQTTFFHTSNSDEYGDDGSTIPSAVLTWQTSDVLMVGEKFGRFEDGILLAWDTARGWAIAELNADGSNSQLEPLPMPVLAPTARVVVTIARAVLGQPLTVDGEPGGQPWAWELAVRQPVQ
ncbi:hypothetical protein [Kitasatospora azatica]|uniref:hypothetical protein n=1 Tax=Kitasatospora azatica TaxID=58347 RepID=UPI000563C875|nr:hypothetical protein [Kitasatospora azatica]